MDRRSGDNGTFDCHNSYVSDVNRARLPSSDCRNVNRFFLYAILGAFVSYVVPALLYFLYMFLQVPFKCLYEFIQVVQVCFIRAFMDIGYMKLLQSAQIFT
jgi:hypothetical protein